MRKQEDGDIKPTKEDIESAEDTMSIVSKYIEALETEVDKEKLDFLMKDLYNESLQTEFNLE